MADVSVTTPPYIPFKMLTNFLDRGKGTLPPKLDPTYLDTMSGSDRAAFMAALKWLGLITQDNAVLPKLVALVDHPENRKEDIAELVNAHYKWVADLNTSNATMGALTKAFDGRNLTGITLKRAMRFYLHAATFAGITLSKNFKVRGVKAGAVTRATRKGTRRKPALPADDDPPRDQTDDDEKKLQTEYVRMLMERAKAQENPEAELLDRIESLLYPGRTTKGGGE